MGIVLFFLLFGRAQAAMDFQVHFDQQFYELKSSTSDFVFKQNGSEMKTKIGKCEGKISKQFEEKVNRYHTSYKNEKPEPSSEYDVEFIVKNKTQKVTRGSRFGTFLRDLPSEIPYVIARMKIACDSK